MSDEITPALSADEWARVDAGTVGAFIRGDSPGIHIVNGEVELSFSTSVVGDGTYNEDIAIRVSGSQVAELIAICNAALPDDSPYKVTRSDVVCLIGYLTYGTSDSRLKSLAAKLAALLPPQESSQADTMRQ